MPPRLFLVILLLATTTGCSSLQNSGRSFMNVFRFRDSASPGDSAGDPWVQEAGKVTSQVHTKEEVIDPLNLRQVFMSEQARSIERNLGVGE